MRISEVISVLTDSGFVVQVQQSGGETRKPDLLLVSQDGQRVIVVEVKDNVFTADVASVNSMVNQERQSHPDAEGMIIYSDHVPRDVEAMAAEQGIKMIRGVGNAKAALLNA